VLLSNADRCCVFEPVMYAMKDDAHDRRLRIRRLAESGHHPSICESRWPMTMPSENGERSSASFEHNRLGRQ